MLFRNNTSDLLNKQIRQQVVGVQKVRVHAYDLTKVVSFIRHYRAGISNKRFFAFDNISITKAAADMLSEKLGLKDETLEVLDLHVNSTYEEFLSTLTRAKESKSKYYVKLESKGDTEFDTVFKFAVCSLDDKTWIAEPTISVARFDQDGKKVKAKKPTDIEVLAHIGILVD